MCVFSFLQKSRWSWNFLHDDGLIECAIMDGDHIFILINFPSSKYTSKTFSMRARIASEGGGEPRVGINAEDVDPGLGSCLKVVEDGNKYLHVMASSMHNMDNGENFAPILALFQALIGISLCR